MTREINKSELLDKLKERLEFRIRDRDALLDGNYSIAQTTGKINEINAIIELVEGMEETKDYQKPKKYEGMKS